LDFFIFFPALAAFAGDASSPLPTSFFDRFATAFVPAFARPAAGALSLAFPLPLALPLAAFLDRKPEEEAVEAEEDEDEDEEDEEDEEDDEEEDRDRALPAAAVSGRPLRDGVEDAGDGERRRPAAAPSAEPSPSTAMLPGTGTGTSGADLDAATPRALLCAAACGAVFSSPLAASDPAPRAGEACEEGLLSLSSPRPTNAQPLRRDVGLGAGRAAGAGASTGPPAGLRTLRGERGVWWREHNRKRRV
jgi:hypothetical protein